MAKKATNKKPFNKDNTKKFKDSKDEGRENYNLKFDRKDRKFSTDRRGAWNECHQSNDLAWYSKFATLFDAATNVAFAETEGIPKNISRPVFNSKDHPFNSIMVDGVNTADVAGPGVMRIDFVPGIGQTKSANDAANRVFQAMMTALFAKTSGGTLPFTPANLGMITMAGQSIAQNIALVKRALGISYSWSEWNANYPRFLLKTMSIDPNSVMGKQNDIIWELDNVIRDYNNLMIPNQIDVFKRHYAMCYNIYKDQDYVKSQLMLFMPEVSYVYNDLGTFNNDTKEYDGVAALIPYKHPCNTASEIDIMVLIDHIKDQIERLRSSADFWTINGAIKRAFESSHLLMIEEVNSEFRVAPVYDEVMSYQIHNSNGVGVLDFHPRTVNPGERVSVYTTGYITGDYIKNLVMYNPSLPDYIEIDDGTGIKDFQYRDCSGDNGFLFNTFKDTVNKGEIMEYTRLMTDWERVGDTGRIEPYSLGTEFVTKYVIYVPTTNKAYPNGLRRFEIQSVNFYLLNKYPASFVTLFNNITAMSRFHKAPRFRIAFGSDSYELMQCSTPIGDLNLWTMIPRATLKQLNDTALLSIYSTDFVYRYNPNGLTSV